MQWTTLTLLSLLTLILFGLPQQLGAVAVGPTPPPAETKSVVFDRSMLEQHLGRKLSFKERLGLRVIQSRQKRAERRARKGDSGATNGWAIAGFACGVVGLFTGLGLILGPCAIVFSILGLTRAKREGVGLKGLAIAGLITGILATLIWVIIILAIALSV